MMNSKDIDRLKMIIEFEKANLYNRPAMCAYGHSDVAWAWDEVGIYTATINKLIVSGYIRKVFSSNHQKLYCLGDRSMLEKEIEQKVKVVAEVIQIPENFLDNVIGYEDVKWVIKRSISADKPVHILFVGAPSTAKSLILNEMQSLPLSVFVSGSSLTKVGLREVLMNSQPRFLIIDEIDKIKNWKELSILLEWMESGRVSVDKFGEHTKIKQIGWLFAAGNRIDKILPEILSRFVKIEIKPYTRAEFENIVCKLLVEREQTTEELAIYIADKLRGLSSDVRDAIKIARLSKTKIDADKIIMLMFKKK